MSNLTWKPNKPIEIEDSIFAIMSKLSQRYKAINLGQGFPDFEGPEWVKEAACEAIRTKPNQYAPMMGIHSLRQAIREKYLECYDLDFDVEQEITVTNGASQALYLVLTALIDKDDEVLIFEPAYDIYAPIIRRAGGVPVGVPLTPGSFAFSADAMHEKLGPNTRMVIVNSPHNPTGTLFSRDDLEVIREACLSHNLIAVTDEVYEHLIYEGEHIPLASLPDMKERTVTISSTAKTFSLTGWKIGYVLAPPEPSDLIRKLHQLVCFCVAKPLQHGIAHGVSNWQRAAKPLMQTLTENRNLLVRGLSEAGFKVLEPRGTFFLVADFEDLVEKRDFKGLGGGDSKDMPLDRRFAEWLIRRENGVGTIPVSSFYVDPNLAPKTFLRFCFAKQARTLELGIERLKEILTQ